MSHGHYYISLIKIKGEILMFVYKIKILIVRRLFNFSLSKNKCYPHSNHKLNFKMYKNIYNIVKWNILQI